MKVVILMVLALLTGCVSFSTNVDRSAMPPFTRLLIVSRLPTPGEKYLDRFLTSFPPQYEVCVIDAGPLALPAPIRSSGVS